MSTVPSSETSGAFVTRMVAVKQVSAEDIESWAALEARAIEPNAYLSPYFVLPAMRHLTPNAATLALIVERPGPAPREIAGVGLFDKAQPSRHFPVSRLTGYQSRHSLLGGILLDRDCHAQALRAMLHHLQSAPPRCQGLELASVWGDGPLLHNAREVGSSGAFPPVFQGAVPRAVLRPANCPALLLDKRLANRLRKMNRKKRLLEERGRVVWRWHRDDGIAEGVVEKFLQLEHMGWKGENGSSLRSSHADELFFREMVQGFSAQRRALFTELLQDGQVIASTCAFISGRVAFSFKIGWDPAFKVFALGILNEIEMMREAHLAFPGIDYFDSGASPDSFINDLWLERRELGSLLIPVRMVGACMLRFAEYTRRIKNLLRPARIAAPVKSET